jgi:Asp-tRNA(Asn)/Glu-tRNA(Gln) amidotransferase A subunit family amidase
MLNAIAGPDPRDPISLDLPPRDWPGVCDDLSLHGLRVAWSPDFGYAPVDPEVRRVCTSAVRVLADLGCEIEEVTPAWDNPAWWAELIWDYQTAIRNRERAAQHPEWIEPTLMAQIEHGSNASAMELGQAQLARTIFYEQARTFMARFDLLVTPQMPCVAWPVDQPPTQIDGTPTPRMFDHLAFTFPFNLTGWPAASLPCGLNSEGLPIALQVVTGWHQDALCLRVAAAFEASHPWAASVPGI